MSTSYSSMLALPPPPSSPSSKQIIKPFSTNQIITSKEPRNHQIDTQSHSSPYPLTKKSSTSTTLLRQPRVRKTNPVVWFAAILCLIFSLVLIFFGIATLIIFLTIKPRNPTVDIPSASLSVVYFDPPQYFNGDFTLLTNFSNPNRRIDARFESGEMELFFSDRLISSQAVQGFALRRKETRVEAIGFISSLVFLPEDVGVKLQKQVESNKVRYSVRGRFRVRVSVVGFVHLSFWIHSLCQIEMTGPPTGVLVDRMCVTKRGR